MAANSRQQHLSKVSSLKDLCQRMAFKTIMDPEKSYSEFASLDNRLQSLLYDSCRDEIYRLRDIEQKFVMLDRRMPKVDRDIWLSTGRVPDEDDWEEFKEDGDTINPYKEMRLAQEKWSYADPDDINSVARRLAALDGVDEQYVNWYSSGDLCFNEDEAKFHIMDMYKAALMGNIFRFPPGFSDRISSPLLLYRASVIFGMPPQNETDGYKCCWELLLQHSSGKGTLELGEHKGCPSARFHGTKAASNDALDLINFLTYVKMPHTYDGTVAGTIA